MPVTEPVGLTGTAHDARPVSLCGWGRIAASSARLRCARSPEEVREALAAATRRRGGLIARGAGCSYGDAAQIASGEVLDTKDLAGILSLDRDRQTVTVQAGVTLARLMSHLSVAGLTLPVLPGTRHVTVGGAIASDVHGKSHHCDGSFAQHVERIELCVPGGELRELSREREQQLFHATLGGMGLTGVVTEASLKVEPLRSPWVAADLDRTADLDHTLSLLAESERRRWSVAWLDLLAGGARMGRALVSRADPWPDASEPARRLAAFARRHDPTLHLAEDPIVEVPRRVPSGVLRPHTVRLLNALRWHAAPRRERGRRLALAGYLFPLDALGSWSRLYGAQGLLQYQFVVPLGAETELVRCVELVRRRRLPVYLAVLKRLGPPADGPLSFPMEGFTLALDLPGGAPGLLRALDELDEIVAGAGGRVYLTKDVRLRKDVLSAMYPQLNRFLAQRVRVDPAGVLRSDLGVRLGLCEAAP
jgi:decaprenylphospho-beta-D-ribofuranose 2-oxidase